MHTIAHRHHELDICLNAAQLLFDNYELNNSEIIEIVTHLDSNALETLCQRFLQQAI